MDLPPSSLLGRLEAFLPEMEKANQTTEKLAQEGKLEVLDGSLEVAGTDQPRETVEGTDEEDGDKEEEQEEGEGEGAAAPPRTVQLDFALGDFDDSPIAKMEQEKEVAAGGEEGTESSGGVGLDEGDGADGEGGIASLVRVKPMNEDDAPAPQGQSRKPLIEEL